MKFTGKVWKQGNSLLVTIPKTTVEKYNITKNDCIEVEFTPIIDRRIVCQCGKMFDTNGKSDHKCRFGRFETQNDAYLAADLLGEIQRQKAIAHFKRLRKK